MTNDEAIGFLYDIQTDVVYNVTSKEKKALEMAIKALREQKRAKNLCSHWKAEYDVNGRKATYTCANCGTAYQVMLVSSAETKDYADRYCRECGKEMKCVVRTVEPKESEAANGETVR